jgi:hypothetical protein
MIIQVKLSKLISQFIRIAPELLTFCLRIKSNAIIEAPNYKYRIVPEMFRNTLLLHL